MFVLALALVAAGSLVGARPCDLFAAGGTPCVAAHSTTRALYTNFNGPLYQLKRASDSKTKAITPVSAGGIADSAAHDAFCTGTTCTISIIYDQSPRQNHLSPAPPGGAGKGPGPGGYDQPSNAAGAPVTLGGKKVYGVFISPGGGYRNDTGTGIARGDQPQGMYAVLDGTHYNGKCCFDYGNAERNNQDTGNGHMEAIYFGSCSYWGSGANGGPWIMGDLENGLFSGANPKQNTADPSIKWRFVTASVKGKSNQWAIRGGDATKSAKLSTYYNGVRPNKSGYNPMSKEGAIILGIGGDNSNSAQGTFYEGVMTSGFPTDDVDDAVQADIAAAGYATTSLTSGKALNVNSTVSLKVNDQYLTHVGSEITTQSLSSSSDTALKEGASWNLRHGLGPGDCYSFESVDVPGSYIRHNDSRLSLEANDDTQQFHEDATFCPMEALNGQSDSHSIRSWAYPGRYIRAFDSGAYAASNDGGLALNNATGFTEEASWIVGAALV